MTRRAIGVALGLLCCFMPTASFAQSVILTDNVDVKGSAKVANAISKNKSSTYVVSWFTQPATATITNTAAEETVLVGTIILPVLYKGTTIRVQLFGTIANDPVLPGNGTLRVKIGSTVILSRTGGLTAGSSTGYMEIRSTHTVQSEGGSGSIVGGGQFRYDVSTAQIAPTEWNLATAQPVTIDTAGEQTFDVTWQYASALTLNRIDIIGGTVEVIPSLSPVP